MNVATDRVKHKMENIQHIFREVQDSFPETYLLQELQGGLLQVLDGGEGRVTNHVQLEHNINGCDKMLEVLRICKLAPLKNNLFDRWSQRLSDKTT